MWPIVRNGPCSDLGVNRMPYSVVAGIVIRSKGGLDVAAVKIR